MQIAYCMRKHLEDLPSTEQTIQWCSGSMTLQYCCHSVGSCLASNVSGVEPKGTASRWYRRTTIVQSNVARLYNTRVVLIELTKCGYLQNYNEDKEMVLATVSIYVVSNGAECMALVLQFARHHLTRHH